VHRVPPGKNAGMAGNKDGRAPRQAAMRIVIQVNDVGPPTPFDLEKPSRRGVYVFPGIFHPLQLEAALVNFGSDVVRFLSLIG
jgi:hypothetical protein